MPLLRFDPSGSINSDFGVTEEQVSGLSGILAELRTEIVEIDPNAKRDKEGDQRNPERHPAGIAGDDFFIVITDQQDEKDTNQWGESDY